MAASPPTDWAEFDQFDKTEPVLRRKTPPLQLAVRLITAVLSMTELNAHYTGIMLYTADPTTPAAGCRTGGYRTGEGICYSSW